MAVIPTARTPINKTSWSAALLDCSGLPYKGMALEHFMINKAGVALSPGYEFGREGEHFLRMNLACPRSTLTKALQQIKAAVQSI